MKKRDIFIFYLKEMGWQARVAENTNLVRRV